MIKKILGIFVPIITCITLSGQDYVMFQSQYLELRNGEHSALQAGVLKHIKSTIVEAMDQKHIYGLYIQVLTPDNIIGH